MTIGEDLRCDAVLCAVMIDTNDSERLLHTVLAVSFWPDARAGSLAKHRGCRCRENLPCVLKRGTQLKRDRRIRGIRHTMRRLGPSPPRMPSRLICVWETMFSPALLPVRMAIRADTLAAAAETSSH